jgi:FAD:protein FMN transferase
MAPEPLPTGSGPGWRASFAAFAGPCELLVEGLPRRAAAEAARLVAGEAAAVEAAWSRYRPESVVGRINAAAGGEPLVVDADTAAALELAAEAWRLSGGRFDITSGVLRRAWSFAPGARAPEPGAVAALLPFVGWDKVDWDPVRRRIRLPAGMELDLGGLGKELAVDRAAGRLAAAGLGAHALLNFGGDLFALGPRADGRPWRVGLDDPRATGERAAGIFDLASGGLATSGDARRFVLDGGRRLGHVLDPRTGWPPPDAPASVSVLATSCTQAGLLATLALLQGAGAESWLAEQGVAHKVLRLG